MDQQQPNNKNLAPEIYPSPDKISDQINKGEAIPEEKYSFWSILSWQLPLLIVIFIISAIVSYRDGTTGAVLTENFGRYKNYLDKTLLILFVLFIITAFFQSNSLKSSSFLSIFRISMILFFIALLLILFVPPFESGVLLLFLAMIIMVIGFFLLILNYAKKDLGRTAKTFIKFTIIWLIVLSISYVYLLKTTESYFRDYGENSWSKPQMEAQKQSSQTAINEINIANELYIEGKVDEAKSHCEIYANQPYGLSSQDTLNVVDFEKKQQLCNHLLYGDKFPDPYATK